MQTVSARFITNLLYETVSRYIYRQNQETSIKTALAKVLTIFDKKPYGTLIKTR